MVLVLRLASWVLVLGLGTWVLGLGLVFVRIWVLRVNDPVDIAVPVAGRQRYYYRLALVNRSRSFDI